MRTKEHTPFEWSNSAYRGNPSFYLGNDLSSLFGTANTKGYELSGW